jgi:hypothetical protein
MCGAQAAGYAETKLQGHRLPTYDELWSLKCFCGQDSEDIKKWSLEKLLERLDHVVDVAKDYIRWNHRPVLMRTCGRCGYQWQEAPLRPEEPE